MAIIQDLVTVYTNWLWSVELSYTWLLGVMNGVLCLNSALFTYHYICASVCYNFMFPMVTYYYMCFCLLQLHVPYGYIILHVLLFDTTPYSYCYILLHVLLFDTTPCSYGYILSHVLLFDTTPYSLWLHTVTCASVWYNTMFLWLHTITCASV